MQLLTDTSLPSLVLTSSWDLEQLAGRSCLSWTFALGFGTLPPTAAGFVLDNYHKYSPGSPGSMGGAQAPRNMG